MAFHKSTFKNYFTIRNKETNDNKSTILVTMRYIVYADRRSTVVSNKSKKKVKEDKNGKFDSHERLKTHR